MRSRILSFVVGLALLATSVPAEVSGSTSTSITSTATTVTFSTPKSSVLFINNSGSANEVYIRLYWCGETITAATTGAAKIRLEPGESQSYLFNSLTEVGSGTSFGYCGFSAVADTAETATLRYTAK